MYLFLYIFTDLFLLLFSFPPIPFFFYFYLPWSGISLPTDCTASSASCCALWNKTYSPFQKNPKHPAVRIQPILQILTTLNIIRQLLLPLLRWHIPRGPFLQAVLSPSAPFLYPCPFAALLCCSLKRVTPQCLFILFGMFRTLLLFNFFSFFCF